eukprot:11641005-Alexandrium_andersonii.AAC.1
MSPSTRTTRCSRLQLLLSGRAALLRAGDPRRRRPRQRKAWLFDVRKARLRAFVKGEARVALPPQ